MKIHSKGRPKAHAFIKVTCSDTLMAEMLNCSPDVVVHGQPKISDLRKSGVQSLLFLFIHGAFLYVGVEKDTFYLQGSLRDGSDALAAIVKEQLNATQVEYLDNVGQEEHHHALAVMCELRVARLRKQIEEMNPDAKVEEAPVQYSTESLSPKDEGVRSPAIQRKADNGDIAMPTWGQRKEPVGSMS